MARKLPYILSSEKTEKSFAQFLPLQLISGHLAGFVVPIRVFAPVSIGNYVSKHIPYNMVIVCFTFET